MEKSRLVKNKNHPIDSYTRGRCQVNSEDEYVWYVTFISIVFGVLISVWVQPFAELIKQNNGDSISEVLISSKALIGYLMLLILVCLWWWYGIFLGQISPANGFLMYLYDFVSLGTFAVSARLWFIREDENFVFPIAVIVACILMAIRFCIVYKYSPEKSSERRAISAALVVVVAEIIFISGNYIDGFKPEVLNKLIIVLMFCGIMATFLAVLETEGMRWGSSTSLTKLPSDKLKFISRNQPLNLRDEDISEALLICSSAKSLFEQDLRVRPETL